MKAILTLLVALIIFVTALALGAQNDQLVSVNYLIAQSELRVSTLMAVCFLMGLVVMAVLSLLWRLRSRLKSLRRRPTPETAVKEQ